MPTSLSPSSHKNSLAKNSLIETRSRCGRACNGFLKESWIRNRIADLFSVSNPPYALNGSAALHLIFLGKRTPSDIDLRCDDIEATRKALGSRFEEIPRKTTVPVYGFTDENGVCIDLSQNRFARSRRALAVSKESHGVILPPFTVVSYDFEVLFAEKLIALIRKRDTKDLYDAYCCISHGADFGRVASNLREIGKKDGIEPTAILAPSYGVDARAGMGALGAEIGVGKMLEKVRAFVRGIL